MRNVVGEATVLHDREDALKAVDVLADQAVLGSGRVAYVEAGAGMGKTTLVDACAARLAGRGVRVLRARGSELEREFPFGVARQLLTPIARSAELTTAVFAGAAAVVSVLFGEGGASAGGEPFEITHGLYWALANLCDLGAVAVVVDDAHEADLGSLHLVSFLARRLVELPLLLLLSTRPVPANEAAKPILAAVLEAPTTDRLDLPPLSPDAVAAVLRHGLDTEPDARFVMACRDATGGNPFYLQELVRAVRDRGLTPQAQNAREVADLGPSTIVERTLLRLSALPHAAQPLTRAVAILGDGARLSTCARLAGVGQDEAAAAADALVREGVFANGPDLGFAHPIVQSAVLTELGEHSRRIWHARAARLLDEDGRPPELVALHLLRSDPSDDRHLRDVLVRAGRAAAREGSAATAAQLLNRAMAETPAEPDADLRYELGAALASVGNPDGLELMASGVLGTADPDDRVRRALRLTDFRMRSGHLVEALELLRTVRAGTEDPDLLLSIDTARYWAGRLHPQTRTESEQVAVELRRHADVPGPDTPARRTLLAYLGCEAAQRSSAELAWSFLDRALAAPGLLEFVAFDAVTVQASMLSLLAMERHEEFERLADNVLGEAGRRGALLAFQVTSTFRAMALLRRGDLGGAEAEASGALQSAAEQGWERGSPSLAALRATAMLEQGDVAGAAAALAAAEQMHLAPGFPTALMHSARGRIAAERGDLRRGVDELMRCGDTLRAMGIESPGVVPWRSDAAVLLAIANDTERARELAAAEVELAERLAGPIARGRAMHALAQTYRGAERIELLREALATLAGSPASLSHAMVAVELGATLRRAKQPGEARQFLADGLDVAGRCRCAPLVTRAREELQVLGVAPRRAPAYGPLSLTPSEVRVARLAAEGRTNAEIAQRLFVTRKTVEKHLAACFRKLGIESRVELAAGELAAVLGPPLDGPPKG